MKVMRSEGENNSCPFVNCIKLSPQQNMYLIYSKHSKFLEKSKTDRCPINKLHQSAGKMSIDTGYTNLYPKHSKFLEKSEANRCPINKVHQSASKMSIATGYIDQKKSSMSIGKRIEDRLWQMVSKPAHTCENCPDMLIVRFLIRAE